MTALPDRLHEHRAGAHHVRLDSLAGALPEILARDLLVDGRRLLSISTIDGSGRYLQILSDEAGDWYVVEVSSDHFLDEEDCWSDDAELVLAKLGFAAPALEKDDAQPNWWRLFEPGRPEVFMLATLVTAVMQRAFCVPLAGLVCVEQQRL